MKDVQFEPGCVYVENVVACGPGGVQIRGRSTCPSCGNTERRVENVPNSQYRGDDTFWECGAWTEDHEPCGADGNERRRAEFESRWEKALPEGTLPIIDQECAWLIGVRLPDGTEVFR